MICWVNWHQWGDGKSWLWQWPLKNLNVPSPSPVARKTNKPAERAAVSPPIALNRCFGSNFGIIETFHAKPLTQHNISELMLVCCCATSEKNEDCHHSNATANMMKSLIKLEWQHSSCVGFFSFFPHLHNEASNKQMASCTLDYQKCTGKKKIS